MRTRRSRRKENREERAQMFAWVLETVRRCRRSLKLIARHNAGDLKEISGSRHCEEGDPDFSLVPEKKKSINGAEEDDVANFTSGTPERRI